VKFGFIAKHRGPKPVDVQCEALGVSRSGLYAWRMRGPSVRAQTDAAMLQTFRSSLFLLGWLGIVGGPMPAHRGVAASLQARASRRPRPEGRSGEGDTDSSIMSVVVVVRIGWPPTRCGHRKSTIPAARLPVAMSRYVRTRASFF